MVNLFVMKVEALRVTWKDRDLNYSGFLFKSVDEWTWRWEEVEGRGMASFIDRSRLVCAGGCEAAALSLLPVNLTMGRRDAMTSLMPHQETDGKNDSQ